MTSSSIPSFTIVVTCYNKVGKIVRAIESALNQGTDVEVIVVDDVSTDGSRNLLKQLTGERVSIIFNDVNVGALKSYIAGIRAATGRYIVLLDGDDLLPDGFLAALSKSNWLDERTCIRPKMAKLSAPDTSAPSVTSVVSAATFRPGSLLAATGSTGGAALIFPKTMFDKVDRSLPSGWPDIRVQDHVLPGLIYLASRRVIKSKTVGYLFDIDHSGSGLGKQTALMNHDRLMSDATLLNVAELPRQNVLSQGLVVRFLLKLALIKRIRKYNKLYQDGTLPGWTALIRDSSVRRNVYRSTLATIKARLAQNQI